MARKKRDSVAPSTALEPDYEFHKYKKQLAYLDKTIYVLVILWLGVFRIDVLMIGVYFFLFPYLLATHRKNAVYHLLVSSAVAVLWMAVGNSQYGYNREVLSLFGLNTFPLFAWAAGLFAMYIIYSHWEHKVHNRGWIAKLLLFTAMYIPLLLLFETVSYHLFDIRNLATAMYAGLPICNCIHAPSWMQAAYILMGPIYFVICEALGLENPHHLRKKKK